MQILSRTRQYPHPLKFCKRLVSEVWAEWGKLGSFSLRASTYSHKSFTPMDKKSLYFTNFPVHSTIITHNLHKLVRGGEGLKYPMIIKRDPFDEKSKTLQTTAKSWPQRARSDFFFAASTTWFEAAILEKISIHGRLPPPSGFSNNLCSLFSCNSSWRKGNRLVSFVHCCKELMELAGVLVNDGMNIGLSWGTPYWRRKCLSVP